MIFGITMAANVWMVIWPQQRVILANAAGAAGRSAGRPGRAGRGPQGAAGLAPEPHLLRSRCCGSWWPRRTSTWRPISPARTREQVWAFIIIALGIALVLELNALGVIGGTAPGPLKWPYENHRNAIITGFVFWAVLGSSRRSCSEADATARPQLGGEGRRHAGVLVAGDVADQRVGARREVEGADLGLPRRHSQGVADHGVALVVDHERVDLLALALVGDGHLAGRSAVLLLVEPDVERLDTRASAGTLSPLPPPATAAPPQAPRPARRRQAATR